MLVVFVLFLISVLKFVFDVLFVLREEFVIVLNDRKLFLRLGDVIVLLVSFCSFFVCLFFILFDSDLISFMKVWNFCRFN